jgi:hypothetical protein
MQRAINFIGLLLSLFICGSCKPEEDFYAPEIIFTEPEAGLVVNLPDTIDVSVRMSDHNLIRTVILTLVNEDMTPILPSLYYYPDSMEYSINAAIPLIDKSLASGAYNLMVIVSDGPNQKNQYQPIILKEIPVRLEAYFVITAQFDFKSTIIKLNTAYEPDTQFVFPHGYWLTAVQGMWGEFFFVSPEPSDLTSFNPETFETEWNMAAAPPRPLFTALIPDNELVFSTANGDAGILASDGNISLRTQAFDNKTIQCLAADDKYIFAAHVSLSGDIHELTVFSRLTGDIWEQRLISGEIRSMVPVSNKLLIFLHVAGGVEIQNYDPVNFILTELRFLPGENITSTEKISDNQVLVVTADRVISFNPESNQLENFKDEPYKFCRYDPVNDEVFLVRDTTLFGFSRTNGNLMVKKSFPDNIADFQILYNK